ncbi:MAG: hypothetical protein GC168_10840 [Candidatus Hydrogenedens sp.]|nr:hypothetical protein [Candidatus Hydrogenedens sp.]
MVTETKKPKLTRFLSAVVGVIALAMAAGSAQAQLALSLTSASNEACSTDALDVVLSVENATNVGSFGVEILYDINNLTFEGTAASADLTAAGWGLVNGNQPDPNTGRIILGGARLLGTAVNGNVDLMTISFSCKPGACPSMTTLTLAAPSANTSGAALNNGQITCGQFPTLTAVDASGACPDVEVLVPIVASNFNTNISSFGVEITYNPAELTFVGVAPGADTAAAGWGLVNGNEPVPGSGTVILGGARLLGTAIPGGELINVRFTSATCPVTSSVGLQNASANTSGAVLVGGTVTLIDNQPPVAVCQNITVNLSDGSFDATALDGGSSDADANDTLAFFIGTDGGPTSQAVTCDDVTNSPITVTLVVSDGSATDTCDAQVTVVDDVDPTITAIATPLVVTLDASGAATIVAGDLVASAADSCGTPTVTASQTSFSCADLGNNVITLTATDAAGNTATATATVTVVDDTDPVITAIGTTPTISLNAGGTAAINAAALTASATDACGAPTLTASPSSVSCANLGNTVITLTATDSSGNTATTTATVNVVDSIAPTVVTQNVNVVLDASGNGSITAAQVNNGSSDNCTSAGSLTLSLDVTEFDCSNEGTNVVTLTVTDGAGNSATGTAQVTVSDNTDPTLTLTGTSFDLSLDDNGEATLDVATVVGDASDACGLDGAATLSQSSFDCSNIGANTVTVSVSDVNGNSASATITVNVSDNVAPTADFAANTIVLELDGSGAATLGVAAVATVSDNCGTPSVTLSKSTFGCSDVGATQTVDVTVTDGAGNETSGSVTVEVVDNAAPTVVAQDITVDIGTDGAPVTITADDVDNGSSDNCSVELSIDVDTFSCLNIGANTVTLTGTDPSGNTATAVATVTVTNTSGSCTVVEGEGDGDGGVEGEGEGVATGCVDADGNGIPDNAFECLVGGGSSQVIDSGVDGGCLVNVITQYFSNTGQGGDVTVSGIVDPNNTDITFSVSVPVDSIAQGSNGILIIQVGCDLVNVLRGDDSATTLDGNLILSNVPLDEQIDGSPYITVSLVENSLSKIERLDGNATIVMTGSDANTVEDPTLYVHGAEAFDADANTAGEQIGVRGDAACAPAASCWQPVNGAVDGSGTVTATIQTGNVALFTQPAPQVPYLAVSPNPAFDRIFGYTRAGTTGAPITFTLENIGPGVVTGTATLTSQTPAGASAFAIVAGTSNTNYNLAGQGTAPINVTFSPALANIDYTAVLRLTNTSVPANSPNSVIEVTLRGTGWDGGAKAGILGCGLTGEDGFGMADAAVVLLVLLALAAGSRAFGKARQH